jgi:hypothetical protein
MTETTNYFIQGGNAAKRISVFTRALLAAYPDAEVVDDMIIVQAPGTEVTAETIRQARLEDRDRTIKRAIKWLTSNNARDIDCVLYYVNCYTYLKQNHARLVGALMEVLEPGYDGVKFSEWKISQQICEAAGLPY